MKTVFITGATDGIGLEMAKLYQARGYRLILLGRRPLGDLDPQLFRESNYLQADLDGDDYVELVESWLSDQGIEEVDLLIHNAGAGWVGKLEEQPVEELFAVNLLAPVLLTRALLDRVREKLVFVSSIVTALPTPKFSVYGATKAALDGFARSLRVELHGRSIDVQVIHPGATKTGIHLKSGMKEEKTQKFAAPRDVAAKIVSAIDSQKRAVTIGFGNRMLKTLGPLLFKPALGPQSVRRVLITGGADGIGKALVKQYASEGCHVTWVDRDQVRSQHLLQELEEHGWEGEFREACLIGEPCAWMTDLQPFDLVIHNAGISSVGYLSQLSAAEQERVLRLNFLAPLLITQQLSKTGLLPKSAGLVFLSSLSHYTSYPGASSYAASKSGVAHFGRSLSWQRPVLTVFPGPTKTAHARRYSPDNSKESSRMPPEHLAELIFRTQSKGGRKLIPGAQAKVSALLGLLFPKLTERLMKRLILDKLQDHT